MKNFTELENEQNFQKLLNEQTELWHILSKKTAAMASSLIK